MYSYSLYNISQESIHTLRRCSSVGIKPFIPFIISDFPHRFSSKGNNFHLAVVDIAFAQMLHTFTLLAVHIIVYI